MDQFSFLFSLLAGAFALTLVWGVSGLVRSLARAVRRHRNRAGAADRSGPELRERFFQVRELRRRARR